MKSWMDTDRNDRKFPFEATTAGQLPDSVLDWIAKTWLLYDVPFQYLVPDERFLPYVFFIWIKIGLRRWWRAL